MSSVGVATGQHLSSQWRNPSDVTPILMVIGGDVVQKALAAGAGIWWITPVCFSFGWVAYSFIALMNLIGNGCLMPVPDFSMKLINLENGYTRENTSWSFGRLVRDLVATDANSKHATVGQIPSTEWALETGQTPEVELKRMAIRIKVYDATSDETWVRWWRASDSATLRMYAIGLVSIIVQVGLATVPIVLKGEWDILILTCIGTFLAQLAGCLPQWRVEKLPNHNRKKEKTVALTAGNGSVDIIVLRCDKSCWDMEAFASAKLPRAQRDWVSDKKCQKHLAKMSSGLPLGYWLTRIVVGGQCILWLAFLVNVTSKRSMNWVLITIGLVGVFQNTYTASMRRDEKQLNLCLTHAETIEAAKVMDGIMDLHVRCGVGRHLLAEFFTGSLRPNETRWWEGDTESYDQRRQREFDEDSSTRTPPLLNQVQDNASSITQRDGVASGQDVLGSSKVTGAANAQTNTSTKP